VKGVRKPKKEIAMALRSPAIETMVSHVTATRTSRVNISGM